MLGGVSITGGDSQVEVNNTSGGTPHTVVNLNDYYATKGHDHDDVYAKLGHSHSGTSGPGGADYHTHYVSVD